MNYFTCTICIVSKPENEFYLRTGKGRYRPGSRRKECKACYSIKNRIRKHGVSEDDYKSLLALQEGACGICHKVPEDSVLSVDHDHQTGKIRGLLCNNCNVAIGLLNDSLDNLRNAYDYLEKASKI